MSGRRLLNLATIAGRMQSERERLGLTLVATAALLGVSKNGVANWERDSSRPNADALATIAEAGADVLYIVTGRRDPTLAVMPQGLPGVTVRQALAMLDPVDRRRLLLDLLADELRA